MARQSSDVSLTGTAGLKEAWPRVGGGAAPRHATDTHFHGAKLYPVTRLISQMNNIFAIMAAVLVQYILRGTHYLTNCGEASRLTMLGSVGPHGGARPREGGISGWGGVGGVSGCGPGVAPPLPYGERCRSWRRNAFGAEIFNKSCWIFWFLDMIYFFIKQRETSPTIIAPRQVPVVTLNAFNSRQKHRRGKLLKLVMQYSHSTGKSLSRRPSFM